MLVCVHTHATNMANAFQFALINVIFNCVHIYLYWNSLKANSTVMDLQICRMVEV